MCRLLVRRGLHVWVHDIKVASRLTNAYYGRVTIDKNAYPGAPCYLALHSVAGRPQVREGANHKGEGERILSTSSSHSGA
ncbi:MAG: hypothetical protein GC179_23455 [Anaerolineaceae bacterium]|nr:hypothetical protein [Anaerolineaceae bacterium]